MLVNFTQELSDKPFWPCVTEISNSLSSSRIKRYPLNKLQTDQLSIFASSKLLSSNFSRLINFFEHQSIKSEALFINQDLPLFQKDLLTPLIKTTRIFRFLATELVPYWRRVTKDTVTHHMAVAIWICLLPDSVYLLAARRQAAQNEAKNVKIKIF